MIGSTQLLCILSLDGWHGLLLWYFCFVASAAPLWLSPTLTLDENLVILLVKILFFAL
jgi:hypothetical protein